MPGQIGNKGGGRKSARDERLRELVVSKALGKYIKALRDVENMDDKQWVRIKEMCLPVVTKDMANKLANADGGKIENITAINMITNGDKPKTDNKTGTSLEETTR